MDLLLHPLSAHSSLPMYKQLSDAIREAIFCGRLKPGQPIPSLRELTDLAHVCRATALKAHEDLQNQGLIAADAGRRSIVTFNREGYLPDSSEAMDAGSERLSYTLSRLSETIFDFPDARMSTGVGGDSALLKIWKKLTLRQVETVWQVAGKTAGFETIENRARAVMQDYLSRARAVSAERRQMRFSVSNDFLLFLTARVLTNVAKRLKIVIGAGSPPAVTTAFQACGAEIIECPVDALGLDVDAISNLVDPDDKDVLICIYVNPSHHYSNGVVMPIDRRHKLIATARSLGAVIFEDDIESEHRYAKNPLPSLQGMSAGVDVFYLSSINALMPPLIKVALLVVPQPFVFAFNTLSSDRDLSCLTLAVLSDLVEDGHLELHINIQRKARVLLKQKMIYAITKHMRSKARVITQTAADRQVFSVDSNLPAARMLCLAEVCSLHLELNSDSFDVDRESKQFSISLHQMEEEFEEKFCAWSKLLSSEGLSCENPGGVT